METLLGVFLIAQGMLGMVLAAFYSAVIIWNWAMYTPMAVIHSYATVKSLLYVTPIVVFLPALVVIAIVLVAGAKTKWH